MEYANIAKFMLFVNEIFEITIFNIIGMFFIADRLFSFVQAQHVLVKKQRYELIYSSLEESVRSKSVPSRVV